MPTIISDPITLSLVVSGNFGGGGTVTSTISLDLTLGGRFASSILHNLSTITLSLFLSADVVSEPLRHNWVAWSKIGDASFALDSVNDAGFRPMEWPGHVFCVKRLGEKIIVYGSSGITAMLPVTAPFATFGFGDILKAGLKSKNAIAGDDTTHYFIDRLNALWRLRENELARLGYEEYLITLTNPSLFYDPFLERLLISDATKGFIYTANHLGGGYGNLTGWCYDVGTLRVASTTTGIIRPLAQFSTDILDFGRRGHKTVESVQVGTDVLDVLQIAYDFRYGYRDTWRTTKWVTLNRECIAYLKITASEFRIKLRSLTLQEFAVDYINVQFKTTDQRFSRSAFVDDIRKSAFAGRVSDDTSATT